MPPAEGDRTGSVRTESASELAGTGCARGPLRILMVAPEPFFTPRGTPFSVLHRIRALVSAGHRVDLVTYPFGEDVELEGLRIIRSSRPPGVRDVGIGPSIRKLALDLPLFATTRRLLRQHEYDVLHTHEEAAFFGAGLASRHGLLHVYDMHSSLPQQLANFRAYNFAPLRKIFERMERYVLAHSDGVVTICQDLADIAEPVLGGVPHAMIENTGDDTKVFAPGARDIRRELGLSNRKVILYTGTLEAYQGIDLLIDAMKRVRERLADVHLLVVGGSPEQVSHYRGVAASRGLDDFVTYVGMVHPAEIPSFLQVADVIVSPRCSGTNTPLKIYGYLRTGRALVATDLPTHTQVLDGSLAELVSPDPEAFAAGILRVLTDEEHRDRLAKAAVRHAEEHFSDQQYVSRVNAFYNEVIAARSNPVAA